MEILNIPIGEGHIVQGDTISEILFEFDSDIDLSTNGVIIKMQVYNNNIKIIDIETGQGITILSDKKFKIDEVSKDDNTLPTFADDTKALAAGLIPGNLYYVTGTSTIKRIT